MEITLEQYFHEFRQYVLLEAELRQSYKRKAFLDFAADKLTESGFISEFEHSHYKKSGSGHLDGFHYDAEAGDLTLFVADHQNRIVLEPLYKQAVDSAFKNLRKFYLSCRNHALYEGLEESFPVYRVAKGISDHRDDIRTVKFILISERNLSTRKLTLKSHDLDGANARYYVWDMSRFYRQDSSSSGREPLEVDLHEMFKKGIPCLQAFLGAKAFPSYVGVVPGDILARLYDEYGTRLLEQNVRCFLQARGNVNKGIKRTIQEEPHMFFAYNNGITATARKVSIEAGGSGHEITKIVDLQIVNGGQTTASLYHASRMKDPPDLSQLFVQMKLSVIEDDQSEELVSNISQYANTQNKVNAADLTSNHPFQAWMENSSRKTWAPVALDALYDTKWFYERSRGQYMDAQSRLTQGEKKKFKAEYPSSQRFTKTDLAKYENVWDEAPRWVNLGAQKNFLQYAQRIQIEWDQRREQFDLAYYQRVIARAIVFKATERLISRQRWYEGGYRANLVAYTLAAANALSRSRNLELDFRWIWKEQAVGTDLLDGLAILARCAFDALHSERRPVRNPSEWAKKSEFWELLMQYLPEAETRLKPAFWRYFLKAR